MQKGIKDITKLYHAFCTAVEVRGNACIRIMYLNVHGSARYSSLCTVLFCLLY